MSGSGFDTIDLEATLLPVSPEPVAITVLIGEAECACLVDATCTRVDSTHLRVDFADPVYYLPTLTWPGAYVPSPALEVISVAPGPITEVGTYDSVMYVTLTTAEQSPVTYTITVFGVEAVDP